jgi:sugar/nucleoside kinase (ribokinase family)
MATEGTRAAPDYVAIGHLSIDRFDGEERLGGSVLYSGVAATRLGRSAGIVTTLTSGAPPELEGILLAAATAESSTCFDHRVTSQGRSLRLASRAPSIDKAAIPAEWSGARLVHLAPIANEVPGDVASSFPRARLVVTPQGWLRRWDQAGFVRTDEAQLSRLSELAVYAVVVSIEDLNGEAEAARNLSAHIPFVALTLGAEGCRVYAGGETHELPRFPVEAVDATGAGDVFATAFFIHLDEVEDAWTAARFASVAAALSLRGKGTSTIPARAEVDEALDAWRAA